MARPWFPFYARDYLADTRHLSLSEHGAYLLLMTAYYNSGGKLPQNEVQMQKICMAVAPDEQAAVLQVLEEFFELREGHYHHARIDMELEKQRVISEKRSAAARKRHAASGSAPAVGRVEGGSSSTGNGDAKGDANGDACASTTTATDKNPFGVSSESGRGVHSDGMAETAAVKPRPGAAVQSPAGEKWGAEGDLALARHIWSRVQPISRQRREPSWCDWANTVRLARERDGVSVEELRAAFDWANADVSFWQANILSPDALRRQLPKLVAQMGRGSGTRGGGRMTFDQLMELHEGERRNAPEEGYVDSRIIEGERADA